MSQFRRITSLFLVSFLILYLEMALIRWVSTEVRIFAYLTNLVLLACFLGGGLGCYLSGRKAYPWLTLAALSLLIVLIKGPFRIHAGTASLHLFTDIPVFLAAFQDTVIHHQRTIAHLLTMQAIGFVSTLVLFFLILMSFFPLGQIMGRLFDEDEDTIRAYSVNIVGSLLGVWAFNVMSFLYAPPWAWFVASVILTALLFAVMKDVSPVNLAVVVITLGVVFALFSVFTREEKALQELTVWSPYQKLSLQPLKPYPSYVDPMRERSPVGYEMNVNNVGYMELVNLSKSFREIFAEYFVRHPDYTPYRPNGLTFYEFPYYLKKDAKNVLVLGAGAGNDVAAALRAGAEHVTAVEIDPGVVALGRKFHPEDPYADPRVTVVIDDARSFIKRTKEKYDLIFFGLLDSQTHSSNMNNMRLDHYVYTEEAFREVKNILSEHGLVAISYFVLRQWIGQRVANLVGNAFGWPPVVFSFSENRWGMGQIMVLVTHDKAYLTELLRENPYLAGFVMENLLFYRWNIPNTTDDWPYMHLQKRMIPDMHLCFIAILLVLLGLGMRVVIPRGKSLDWHFFFLGAAFMLLEFQNINKTALLFGSTWLVNSINITAILVLILLANLVVAKVKVKRLAVPYMLLAAALVLIFAVQLSVFNAWGYWPKAVVATLMLNLPIFFAGIIFTTSFKNTPHKHLAFGSNLIGAVLGGILEYLSMVLGIRMLVVVTLALYGLSYAFLRKRL